MSGFRLGYAAAVLTVAGAVTGCGPAHQTSTRTSTRTSTPAGGTVTYSIRLTPGECHTRDNGTLPDPHCTPGTTRPDVTQATITTTICVPGWTATVRPPASETTHAKYNVSYPAYSVPRSQVAEEDHLIPLELGGSNDISNLWAEAGKTPNNKDPVENMLRKAVCDGRTSLAAAQQAIAADWHTATRKVTGEKGT